MRWVGTRLDTPAVFAWRVVQGERLFGRGWGTCLQGSIKSGVLRWRLSAAISKSTDCPGVEVRTWGAQHRCEGGGGGMSPRWGAPGGLEWGPQQGSAVGLGEGSQQCWPSWWERGGSSGSTSGDLTALLDGFWPPSFAQLRVVAPWSKGRRWHLGWH